MDKSYAVVIPTLDAGKTIRQLAESLLEQTVPPAEIVVVDSSSEDDTVSQVRDLPSVRVLTVARKDFDHGGTRDRALRSCTVPFVVFMTQDALPCRKDCMKKLLEPFGDPRVAAVCGRQVAYPAASAREKAVRAFRYTGETDVWGKEDMRRRGVKAFLLSDVCAAYRVSAYEAVGGFTHPLMTNEDMLIAADFLEAGYLLCYQGKAEVYHSHDYTLRQEYGRNRKIGEFLAKYGNRFENGSISGEGLRMVKTVTLQLLRQGRIPEIFSFWANCGARILGNRAGFRAGSKEKN